MSGKLSLMEELKLKQKERRLSNSYKNDAKNEEEKTPIKTNPSNKPNINATNNNNNSQPKLAQNPQTKALLSQLLARRKPNPKPSHARRKPNPKPSHSHQSSLPNIAGSTDHFNNININNTNININDNNSSSSNSYFSKSDKGNNNNKLSTIKSGDEEEKYGELPRQNDDTISIYTDSTYISTTASIQSINGRKKKKKKRKKGKIVQHGNHITCHKPPRKSSISSDIPPITYQQHTPPNSPPLSLSKRNLDQHNQRMIHKRNVTSALTDPRYGIADGIPVMNKVNNVLHPMNKQKIDTFNSNNKKIEIDIIPSKARHSNEHLDGFDDDEHLNTTSIKPGLHDLSLKDQLYATNIFAFLCSIDLMINIPTLYNACMEIDLSSADNNLFIWILVIYVIFQIISALIISCFMNYERIKWILVILCTFLFFGNILYTHGISVGDSVFLLFVGRAMCGISGSILVIGYSIVTLCSNLLNRESLIVIFRFITSIGMVIGPLIGLLVSLKQFNFSKLWIIKDTNSGSFIMAVLSLLYLIVFIIYLAFNYFIKSKKKKEKLNDRNDIQQIHEKQAQKYNINNIAKNEKIIRTSSDEIISRNKYSEKYNQAIVFSKNRKNHALFKNKYVILLLFLYISCLFTFWSFSAVIVPLGAYNEHNYGNNIVEKYNQTVVYALFAIIGVFFILSFFINRLLNFRFFNSTSFDKRVIIAIQLQCVGYFLLTTFGIYDTETSPYSIPLAQLIFATFFICIGFGIATLQIPAIFCLITGTKLKNIGIRMSWFFVMSSIGRIIGPIFGYYIIKTQNGSIDFLAHLSAFYLLLISFIASLIIMEANKKIGFFPINYTSDSKQVNSSMYNNYNQNEINIGTLHSQRKLHPVPSKSSHTHSVTPYSRPKFHSHFVDESATKTGTNSKSKSKSKSKSMDITGELNDTKEESEDHNDEYMFDKPKKKHFNYSPVNRTESTESIKVTYKPKQTFLAKYGQQETGMPKAESKSNLLAKIKKKSSRLLGKNNKEKEQKESATLFQSVDVGMGDLQL